MVNVLLSKLEPYGSDGVKIIAYGKHGESLKVNLDIKNKHI